MNVGLSSWLRYINGIYYDSKLDALFPRIELVYNFAIAVTTCFAHSLVNISFLKLSFTLIPLLPKHNMYEHPLVFANISLFNLTHLTFTLNNLTMSSSLHLNLPTATPQAVYDQSNSFGTLPLDCPLECLDHHFHVRLLTLLIT